MDKDESFPTADLSNIGRHNGPAYSTGELLNAPLLSLFVLDYLFSTMTVLVGCHVWQPDSRIYSDNNSAIIS